MRRYTYALRRLAILHLLVIAFLGVNIATAEAGQQNEAARNDAESVRVDDATVFKTDVAETNGVIHVNDAVILPKG